MLCKCCYYYYLLLLLLLFLCKRTLMSGWEWNNLHWDRNYTDIHSSHRFYFHPHLSHPALLVSHTVPTELPFHPIDPCKNCFHPIPSPLVQQLVGRIWANPLTANMQEMSVKLDQVFAREKLLMGSLLLLVLYHKSQTDLLFQQVFSSPMGHPAMFVVPQEPVWLVGIPMLRSRAGLCWRNRNPGHCELLWKTLC